MKLRSDLEAANVQHEAAVNSLRKKASEQANEFGGQIEALQKAKSK